MFVQEVVCSVTISGVPLDLEASQILPWQSSHGFHTWMYVHSKGMSIKPQQRDAQIPLRGSVHS